MISRKASSSCNGLAFGPHVVQALVEMCVIRCGRSERSPSRHGTPWRRASHFGPGARSKLVAQRVSGSPSHIGRAERCPAHPLPLAHAPRR